MGLHSEGIAYKVVSGEVGMYLRVGRMGQLSEDRPGQNHPDRSEGRWGRAEGSLHGGAHKHVVPNTERGIPMDAESTKDDGKPVRWEGLV